MRKTPLNDKNKIISISKYLPTESKPEENFSGSTAGVKVELANLFRKHLPLNSKFNSEDQKSIDSEEAFVARFGFSMGRKKRKALFELIETHDLSDKEIKAIHRIGSFIWDGNKLRVGIAGWVFMQGFAQLGIVLNYALIFGLLMVFLEKTTLLQHTISITMFLVIVAFGAFLSNLYLKPYQIIQQRVQVNCKDKPFLYRLRQRTICYLD